MRWMILTVAVALLIGCGGEDTSTAGKESVEFELLSRGESIELKPYIRAQGLTVFDFYADWCPPCLELNKSLIDIKRVHGEKLDVYKLDLVSWESNLARDFGIQSLPYLIVYDDGEIVGNGQSAEVLPILMKRLTQP